MSHIETVAVFINREGNYQPDEPQVYGKLGRALASWRAAESELSSLRQQVKTLEEEKAEADKRIEFMLTQWDDMKKLALAKMTSRGDERLARMADRLCATIEAFTAALQPSEEASRMANFEGELIARFNGNEDAHDWMGWRTMPDEQGREFDVYMQRVGGVTVLDKYRQLTEQVESLTRELAEERERSQKRDEWISRFLAFAPRAAQLLDGWHADGTAWTEWDESVRAELSVLQIEAMRAAEPNDPRWQSLEPWHPASPPAPSTNEQERESWLIGTPFVPPAGWQIGGAGAVMMGTAGAWMGLLCPRGPNGIDCTINDPEHLHTMVSPVPAPVSESTTGLDLEALTGIAVGLRSTTFAMLSWSHDDIAEVLDTYATEIDRIVARRAPVVPAPVSTSVALMCEHPTNVMRCCDSPCALAAGHVGDHEPVHRHGCPAVPVPSEPNATTVPLNDDMDARRWAREFWQQFGTGIGLAAISEDTMLAWFANAIMCGYDAARRKYDTETKEGT